MLGGIILFSFLLGLLVGALTFNSKAIDIADETAMTATPRTVSPITEDISSSVSVMCKPEESSEPTVRYFDVPLSKELQDYIYSVCDTYNVPCELVYGMIEVESGFRANVISATDDYGLMQINICNHEWLCKELDIVNLLDPKQNILAGVYIISSHLEATDGDIPLALMRYNCGATGAKRLWEQGIYSTSYTEKVITAYENYKKIKPPVNSHFTKRQR